MKKILKILLIIIVLIVIITLTFFTVDYIRVQNGKRPIFCISLGGYSDGGTVEYFGLGYKVIAFSRLSGYNEIKIGTWNMQYGDFYDEIEEYENKIIIESAHTEGNEKKVHIEINYLQSQELEKIFDKLDFKEGTCDGLYDYFITFKSNMTTYGLEIGTSCHIIKDGKEAILNAEDSYTIIEIINDNTDNKVYGNEQSTQINDIQFVKTYNIKSDLNESDKTGRYNFYIVEQFQMNDPAIIKVEKSYKLEEGSNYEFTFKGEKKDRTNYTAQEIFTDFYIVKIEKTDKEGLEQRQDGI